MKLYFIKKVYTSSTCALIQQNIMDRESTEKMKHSRNFSKKLLNNLMKVISYM